MPAATRSKPTVTAADLQHTLLVNCCAAVANLRCTNTDEPVESASSIVNQSHRFFALRVHDPLSSCASTWLLRLMLSACRFLHALTPVVHILGVDCAGNMLSVQGHQHLIVGSLRHPASLSLQLQRRLQAHGRSALQNQHIRRSEPFRRHCFEFTMQQLLLLCLYRLQETVLSHCIMHHNRLCQSTSRRPASRHTVKIQGTGNSKLSEVLLHCPTSA